MATNRQAAAQLSQFSRTQALGAPAGQDTAGATGLQRMAIVTANLGDGFYSIDVIEGGAVVASHSCVSSYPVETGYSADDQVLVEYFGGSSRLPRIVSAGGGGSGTSSQLVVLTGYLAFPEGA